MDPILFEDRKRRVFSPLSIAGLAFWLRADAGVFTDALKATPAVNDGDPIYTWADQSGNGRDEIQATLGNRPILKVAFQNSRNVVQFDATNDTMSTAAFTLTSGSATLIVVGRIGAGAATRDYVRKVTTIYLRASEAGGNGTLYIYTPGAVGFAYGNIEDDAFHVIEARYAVGESQPKTRVYKDGSQVATDAASSANLNNNSSVTLLCNEPLNGYLAEVLLYDVAITAGNRADLMAYLRGRWGTP